MEGETAQALPSGSPQVACSLMVETQPLPPAVPREQSCETQRNPHVGPPAGFPLNLLAGKAFIYIYGQA